MYLKNVLVVCGLCSMLAMSSGLMLACTYINEMQDDLGTVLYTCKARVVPVGDVRYVFDISNTSVHLDGRGNNDVEALDYEGATIGFTPRNVSSFFPNLQLIRAHGIGSPSLTREDLSGFSQLRALRFSDNALREIGNDLFIENPLLAAIYLDYNQIRHVAHNVFDHLPDLRTLSLFENRCTGLFVFNQPEQIFELLFDVFLDCPSTFDMIEERIVSGSRLSLTVKSQIDSETAILHERLEAMVEQLKDLEKRVEVLETNGAITITGSST